ncbi:hypothetical protein FJY84_05800 [Candidatus Bathyarchaeota archaeon]|nr:hypothetical protein [Candidatus Bathyarchaeota archaeon]
MNKKIIVGLIAAMLLIPIIPATLAGPNWNVNTDKRYYQAGETVNITVKGVPGSANITIWKGNTTVLNRTAFNVTALGTYNTTYIIPANASVGLYNIIVQSGIASAMTNFFVTKISGEDLAEEYMLVALRAQELADNTLEELENATLPQSVYENYEHGEEALADAEALILDDKFEAALGALNRAQVHFMNAVKIAINAAGKPVEIPDEDALEARIERGLKLIVKLNETVKDFEGNETETEDISDLLMEANVTLTNALSQIGANNNTEALRLIKEAFEMIKDAQDLLKELTKEHKREMMLKFMEKIELRIQKLEEAVLRIRERLGVLKTNKMMTSLKNRLNSAEKLLERLRLRQQVDLKEIEDLLEDIDDDIDGLQEAEYGQLLKGMDKLNAHIHSLNDTVTYGQKKGWDVKALKQTVLDALGDVDEMLESMSKGKQDLASSIINEIKEDLNGKYFGWVIGKRP